MNKDAVLIAGIILLLLGLVLGATLNELMQPDHACPHIGAYMDIGVNTDAALTHPIRIERRCTFDISTPEEVPDEAQ